MSGRIIDISQSLRPGLPVWPGDTAFSVGRRWSQGDNSPVTVSHVTTTVHAGAHADAPLHYAAGAADAASVALEPYVGPCRVIDARGQGPAIGPAFLERALNEPPPRVLLRTFERFPRDQWPDAFTALSADAIGVLASLGVRLVGLNSPSLEPQDSKTMDAHLAVLAADMRVLEGLVLDDVAPGDYELIALPLKLEGADASPVRAVLRSLD